MEADVKYIEAIERIIDSSIPRISPNIMLPRVGDNVSEDDSNPRRTRDHHQISSKPKTKEDMVSKPRNKKLEKKAKTPQILNYGSGSSHRNTAFDPRQSKNDDQPVKGLGDHIPAFMLRNVEEK